MPTDDRKRTTHTDIVIIGAGLGGLCCGAMLARYGYRVTICEAHIIAGGVAHTFEVDGFHFDSGPSILLGLSDPQSINPLKHALDLLDEQPSYVRYSNWFNHLPEGTFTCSNDREGYTREIERLGGERAAREWRALEKRMIEVVEPLAGLPQTVMRRDAATLIPMLRYPKQLPGLRKLGDAVAPFSKILDQMVTDPWLKNLLELECFVLGGMLSDKSLTAMVGFMYRERMQSTVDYPVHGMQGIIDGLLRGFTKYGGRLIYNTNVESVLVENGRAVGVQLKLGGKVMAKRAVVSNASIWDTLRLLPEGSIPDSVRRDRAEIEQTESFMHLHVGFDATGIEGLECHHLVMRNWDVDAPQNVVNISIPSVFDPGMAPAGKHCLHAYLAGNEPWSLWEGLRRTSQEYKDLKEERSQVIWEALEKVVPDIRERAEVSMVGTPITIKRFCRRDRGTYGPVMTEGMEPFLGPNALPVKGLYQCGDSCMPGIGVPSAAGSGIIAANTIVPVWKQWKMLDDFDRIQREGRTPLYTDFKHFRGPQTKSDRERQSRFLSSTPTDAAGA
jgi:phytoene dehydrogenase-like protein